MVKLSAMAILLIILVPVLLALFAAGMEKLEARALLTKKNPASAASESD